MIVLHVLWSPAGREGGEPALFLWGEDVERAVERPLPQAARAGRDNLGAQPREVRSLLRHVADGLLYECAEPGTLEILWPTLRGAPLPSDRSKEEVCLQARLQPWKVSGLWVPPEDVLPLLSALPREAPDPLLYGTAARVWIEAAFFCLGLLARQRIIPTLATQGKGGTREHAAQWHPVLTDEEDRLALETLIQALPPLCRAEVSADGRDRSERRLRDPVFLVRDFIGRCIDASLRRLLAEEGFPECGARRGALARTLGGPLGAWLKGLGWIDPRIEGETRVLEDFAREVRRWNDTLTEPPPGSYRTAFRLVAPAPRPEAPPEAGPTLVPVDPREDARETAEPIAFQDEVTPDMATSLGAGIGDAAADSGAEWVVEFYLQDRNNLDILVPAARVWEEQEAELPWGGRVFERPQDRLLEDLGRASRIFPSLERSLETPAPLSCALSLEEAHAFLSQGAPLLQESGFGILLPSWWHEESSRPRLRLRLRTDDGSSGALAGDAASGLGTDALIRYDWEIALGEAVITPEEFYRLASQKLPLLQVRGRWFELNEEQTSSIRKLLEERKGDNQLTLAEAVHWGMGGLSLRTNLPVAEVLAEGSVQSLLEHIRGEVAPNPITMGPEFHGCLRPYQERGVGWLEFMRQCGLGACLADDMGLGKTVQLIALLLHERKSRQVGPTLVLCPMSVVGNWQREIERFAPGLRVLVHHGLRRLRDQSFIAEAAANDVVISTYALAHRDRQQLRRVSWERLVLDEAQSIKNPATLQSRAVRSLRARTRVALTGTPLENRLAELWSILDVLNPSYLGSRAEFRRNFSVPIERSRDPRRRVTLRRLVQPFLLRRLKTDPQVIRDLPEKLEMRVFCNLTREQATLYQAVVGEMLGAIDNSQGITRRGLILATLTRLKQICNHPAHFLQDGSRMEKRSGKSERLREMLEEILAEGDRALVFTQFTEMGLMLQAHLSAVLRCEVLFLHGGTPKAARDRMVDRFQAPGGPPIFLLSLRAGGTGLNLTAATHVFHFDRWWNPAVEDQATDRAFRIGQTRNVQVHKFVCVGTLEEKIDQMILEKRDLASSIVGAGEQWLTEMDTAQLREMMTLSLDAVSED
jgi:SNF2 family DNA or RNA helicase